MKLADPRLSLTCRDAGGDPHALFAPHSGRPRDRHAWISHYFFRSVEEYVWKWSRGRGDQPLQVEEELIVADHFLDAFASQFNADNEPPDAQMARCVEGLMAERERLLRGQGVAAARDSVIAHYRSRSQVVAQSISLYRETASPSAVAFCDLLLEDEAI